MTTRERILEAAGAIFAERGLKDATIREIVQQAQVNQAAVNYHFRDKDSLYYECLLHGVEVSFSKHPVDEGSRADAPPEELLLKFIQSAMNRAASHGESWHGRLMMREMASPSQAFQNVVKEILARTAPYLHAVISRLNPVLSPDELWLCAHSVGAQCHFFIKAERHLEWTRPDWSTLSKELRMQILSQHIWSFSLAAIRGMR